MFKSIVDLDEAPLLRSNIPIFVTDRYRYTRYVWFATSQLNRVCSQPQPGFTYVYPDRSGEGLR